MNETTNTMEVRAPSGAPDELNILNIGEEAAEQLSSQYLPQRKGLVGLYQSLNEMVQSFTTIPMKDKVTFFQLLAIMIAAGVPLVKSLYVLANQTKNMRFRKVVATMAQNVESGRTLSESMGAFHNVFDDAQIGMIRAAEASGKLIEILKDIAHQAEKAAAITSKVKGAMIYPAVVFTMMSGAVIVILTMVIPKIMELFTQTNAKLPASTLTLLAISDFLRNHSVLLVIGLMIFIGVFSLWKKTSAGRYQWHNVALHIPVFGRMLRGMAISRFTRALSSLLTSGIPIVEALTINADAIGNDVYRRRIVLASEDVARGIPLAENLTESNFLFPEMVVSMIAIGEQTAELHNVAGKIADYYEDEVDQMAANMSKLLEPIIMGVMGVVVGGLIVSVMQPIFSLMDVVGNI